MSRLKEIAEKKILEPCDIQWLISEAEKVERLETINKGLIENNLDQIQKIQKYEKQIKESENGR